MVYVVSVLVNFIGFAAAVWLGVYIVSRSPRSLMAWLAGLSLWSLAGFCLNVLLALNPPPSPNAVPFWMRPLLWFWPSAPFEHGWANWLQGWQITLAVMFWHHLTVHIRPGGMTPWRWARVLTGYAVAVAASIGLRFTPYVFSSVQGDPLYLTALVPGPLYRYYMGAMFLFIGMILFNLTASMREAATDMQRRQLRLIVIATIIAGLTAPVSFISYWSTLPLPRVLVSLPILIAVLLLGYGIARYSALVEGRVIGRDFLYNGLAIIVIIGLYLVAGWGSVVSYGLPLASLAVVVALAIVTHSLVDFGRRAMDLLFYNRETREMRASLRRLAHQAHGPEAMQEALPGALEALCDFARATYGLILLFDEGQVRTATSYRFRAPIPDISRESLHADDVRQLAAGHFRPPLEEAALLIPLYAGDCQQGAIILGRPENASAYGESELEGLLDAGDRIAEFLRNARRESEHLAELARLANAPERTLARRAELPAKAVEDALRNLHDYTFLADGPLAALKQVTGMAGPGPVTHLDRGKCIYQLVLDALEKMRPSGDLPHEPIPRQWYPYLILHDAYLRGKPNNEIMARLYISEGTFNRTRRAAIRSLARELTEIEAAA